MPYKAATIALFLFKKLCSSFAERVYLCRNIIFHVEVGSYQKKSSNNNNGAEHTVNVWWCSSEEPRTCSSFDDVYVYTKRGNHKN